MEINKNKIFTLSFVLSRFGVAVGILIFLLSIIFFLFVPKQTPVSIKLSNFERIILPQDDDCAATRSWVSDGEEYISMPPLHIVNQMTLIPEFRLLPRNETILTKISIHNLKLVVLEVNGDDYTDLGSFDLDELILTGDIKSISAHFGYLETPTISAYYCDPNIIIMGDYLNYSTPRVETALIQSFVDYDKKATLTVIGDIDLKPLNIHQSSNEIVLVFESYPRSERMSDLDSSFTVFADGISHSSNFPYGISNKDWISSIPIYELEAKSEKIEIHAPTGVIQIGNGEEIELSAPTSSSLQSLILEPSILYQSSDFSINANSNSGQLEIFGIASSIRLNNQELGLVAWYSLPEYIQTGLVGILIATLSGFLAQGGKYFSFFKPPKHRVIPGEFVCETRSGFIIAGKLVKKPSKKSPFYVFEQVHRKHRTDNEWEKLPIKEMRLSLSDVEQSYKIDQKSKNNKSQK